MLYVLWLGNQGVGGATWDSVGEGKVQGAVLFTLVLCSACLKHISCGPGVQVHSRKTEINVNSSVNFQF